jgi:hypothetical protein
LTGVSFDYTARSERSVGDVLVHQHLFPLFVAEANRGSTGSCDEPWKAARSHSFGAVE